MKSESSSQSLKNQPREYGVAAFVLKLYDMLRPNNAQVISWHPEGTSFTITNMQALSQRILPSYFRHQNSQSFIRQLNMYSFTKIKNNHHHRFTHPHFQRGHPSTLKFVKRRPQRKKRMQENQDIMEENIEKSQQGKKIISNIKENIANIGKPQRCPSAQKTKRVCFNVIETEQGIEEQKITTLMNPSLKWVQPNKQDVCWSRIRSFKSIDCSLKLIDNPQEGQQMLTVKDSCTIRDGQLLLDGQN